MSSVKTLKAELRGRARLFMVAPARHVTGKHRASTWLRLRQEIPSPLRRGSPLLPTPLLDGGWGDRPVTPSEGTAWLRSFVAQVC